MLTCAFELLTAFSNAVPLVEQHFKRTLLKSNSGLVLHGVPDANALSTDRARQKWKYVMAKRTFDQLILTQVVNGRGLYDGSWLGLNVA